MKIGKGIEMWRGEIDVDRETGKREEEMRGEIKKTNTIASCITLVVVFQRR